MYEWYKSFYYLFFIFEIFVKVHIFFYSDIVANNGPQVETAAARKILLSLTQCD